jgi:hypothetical protein
MDAAAVTAEAIGLGELRSLDCPEGPYLLLRLARREPELGVGEAARLTRWLRARPSPVIALAEPGAHESLQQACDVVVEDVAQLGAVLDNVRHSPLAAMVLVQVLRSTEHATIEHALIVESLAYATLQGGPEFLRWLQQRGPRRSSGIAEPGPAVVVERDGNTLAIRLNRPARRNALSVEMRDGLHEALELVVADPSIGRVVFSGSGPCFSSGGDLDEFGTAPDAATAHAVRSLRLPAALLHQCAGRIEFRVHGACIGAGAELPAFGGRVRAARDACFQLPEIRMGLIPGAGGCVSIPRRIGRQRACWLALSAERIDAGLALDWGLVDEIGD